MIYNQVFLVSLKQNPLNVQGNREYVRCIPDILPILTSTHPVRIKRFLDRFYSRLPPNERQYSRRAHL